MLFARLSDGEVHQQKAKKHGRKTGQTELQVRQCEYLPEQCLVPGGIKKPRDSLDHQYHTQDRHQKCHEIPSNSSLHPSRQTRCGRCRGKETGHLRAWQPSCQAEGERVLRANKLSGLVAQGLSGLSPYFSPFRLPAPPSRVRPSSSRPLTARALSRSRRFSGRCQSNRDFCSLFSSAVRGT